MERGGLYNSVIRSTYHYVLVGCLADKEISTCHKENSILLLYII